jgi:TolB-like protein/Flp pilus assembly protein TadD
MGDGKLAFGPFMLDVARGALLRNGAPVALGQRALAVLAALGETPGRTVAKEDLLARVWPSTIVEEGNLTVQIAALRKALGDGQDWILTVPRIGYRLAVPTSAAVGAATLPSLAVLPFAEIGGDPEVGHLADGIVNDVISALSRFRGLVVTARGSTFVYQGRAVDSRQAARELGVRYLIEGSAQRSGDRLRITARLVDGETGGQLWAQHFDGGPEDAFDFQDRTTATIVSAVEPWIEAAEIERSQRDRPGSADPYDLYLRSGWKAYKQAAEANAEAYARLTEALARDPDNPRLLAYAARALEHRIAMGWPPVGPDDVATCADLARRGLDRAAGDATVIASCGLALLQGAKEYDLGLAVLRAATEANPDDVTTLYSAGIAHLHCGTLEDALLCFHHALNLNPRDATAQISMCGIAHVQMVLGNYAAARDWAMRSLALAPQHDPTFWMLIASNAQLGRLEEARAHLGAFRRLAPNVTVASLRAGQCARDPGRIEPILEGLRLAGLPEE